jgi:hypothetical protein
VAVDSSCEPVRLQELQRWIGRQRNEDRLIIEREANQQKSWAMHPDDKETFLDEKRDRENAREAKINHYLNLIDGVPYSDEFAKVYDVNLIIGIGRKLFDDLYEENRETNELFEDVPRLKRYHGADDQRNLEIDRMRERLEVRKEVEERQLSKLSRMKVANEAIELNYPFQSFEKDIMENFEEAQK